MTQGLFKHAAVAFTATALALTTGTDIRAQRGPGLMTVSADSASELRRWDDTITQLSRDGGLVVREVRADSMLAGRSHERMDQHYKGVRVFGGDVVRQSEGSFTISLYGNLYQGIALETTPAIDADAARAAVAARAGVEIGQSRVPELVVLPMADGSYRLTWRLRAMSGAGLIMYFLDANTGEVVLELNDLKSEAAKGIGKGVLGDDKKLSVAKVGTAFRTSDELRPPAIDTFDMRGNVSRTMAFLNGITALTVADLATDTDNDWSDPAVVDGHAYAGYTYDYFFRRFGRRGLDNRDIPLVSLIHPANRQDVLRQPPSIIGAFYLNAGYYGDGVMVYGEGLPSNLVDSLGRHWDYTSGALDIIAHELTHGVTDYTSKLVYQNESGALNEAFSDMMGTSAEFYHQPAGGGPLQADYLLGEDVITPGGIRSMANPTAYGDPDHYSQRYTGPEDNGGVHINSGIANHAFYLAIEGGTHRLSRQTVQGVGAANREQVEKVFYRAFTEMMPANATFAVARAVSLQAARDLYGAGGAVERAIAQAWTAVGVN